MGAGKDNKISTRNGRYWRRWLGLLRERRNKVIKWFDRTASAQVDENKAGKGSSLCD